MKTIQIIHSLVLCVDEDCGVMYTGLPVHYKDLLPCGHRMATATFCATEIKSFQRNKGDIERVLEYIEEVHNER